MRITVDIDENMLKDLVSISGEKKKSPAVKLAVEEYVNRAKCKELGRLIREGAFADSWPPGYDPDKFSN
jgi:metal-responsive CopG/Arc/MetJ family transcriptional regulator